MVPADEVDERGHRPQRLADLEADHGVLLDLLVLRRSVSLAGLVQVLERDPDLADVVEQPGAAEVAPLRPGEAERAARAPPRRRPRARSGPSCTCPWRRARWPGSRARSPPPPARRRAPCCGAGSACARVSSSKSTGLVRKSSQPGGDARDAVLAGHERGHEHDGDEARALVDLEEPAGLDPRHHAAWRRP